MADNLKLQVLFSAIDKLTAPIERMRQGSKGLTADLAATRTEIRALGQAQRLLGAFKLKDAGLQKTTAELEEARAATSKLRSELAATDAPTIKMAKALERAEKTEARLAARHQEQSTALTELRGKLDAAGVETADLARAEAELAQKMGTANARMDQQKASLGKIAAARANAEKWQERGNNMALTGGAMTAGITLPVVGLLKESYAAAKESADALKQVSASLAGMGNASGRTLPQLEAQAKALQRISLFDDDDILRKVTTSMLTFDKVSGPIFDRAQLAAVNLSAKFGKDLQSSSIMVGKALQNPLKGLTALTKVGVSFTDAQQDQIKAMMAAGDVAGAQAIILGELERQTKGAAEAARAADPGAAATNSWNDFKETVGAVVIEVLPPLTDALRAALDAFNNLSPGTRKFLVIAAMAVAVLGPVIAVLGAIVTAIGAAGAVMGVAFLPALGIILAVIAVVALLAYGAYQIYKNWGAISAFFGQLWEGIKQKFWEGVASIKAKLTAFVETMKFIGKAMMQGLIMSLNPALLVAKLIQVAKAGVTAFKNYFGIKSPSRLMMAMGGFMTQGLAQGIDRGGKVPLKAMGRMAAGIGAAAALGTAAPAFAGSGGAGQRAPGSGMAVTYNVTIQIQGADAGDPRAAALAIKRELDQLLAIEARGNYIDV